MRHKNSFTRSTAPLLALVGPIAACSGEPDPHFDETSFNGWYVQRFEEFPCLSLPLPADDVGRLPCVIVAADDPEPNGCAPCSVGKPLTDPKIEASVKAVLAKNDHCPPNPDCKRACLCQVDQFEGADLAGCQESTVPFVPIAFCYIDGSPYPGEDASSPSFLRRSQVAAICDDRGNRVIKYPQSTIDLDTVLLLACTSPFELVHY